MKTGMRFKAGAIVILALTAMLLVTGARLQAASGDTFRFVVYADSRGNYTPGKRSTAQPCTISIIR